MYCRLIEVIFPTCFMIAYTADFLTKQTNTGGDIAWDGCGKDSCLHLPIIFKLHFFSVEMPNCKSEP